ncbi:MAG TPA: quinone oxidoreductase [Candidatus Polarisedimenticolaceae bacterium]|nr:quinone oxidoreductase [Candidatus Polarisedimenticolaceae bacterium]
MPKAIRIHRTGGPEVLVWEDVPVGDPGPGQVRLRQTAVGLNYIDTYHRTGLYPLPALPAVLGREAAGVVTAVGPGVSGLAPGQRVAYPLSAGAYAEERCIAADLLVPLPDDVGDRTGAAAMLKGLTAHYLLRRTYRVKPGDTILLHAAAGGVGLIACQWARALGARVIGTVGSREKAELAKAHGCEHTIVHGEQDFVARVRELTGGAGVPVVYDSVGRDTFARSLDCLVPFGLLVSFGQSSGPVPPFEVTTLAEKGSLFLTRPTLATYIARREELLAASAELFAAIAAGQVRIEIGRTYPLSEAARAHADLEARRTTGSVVLLP